MKKILSIVVFASLACVSVFAQTSLRDDRVYKRNKQQTVVMQLPKPSTKQKRTQVKTVAKPLSVSPKPIPKSGMPTIPDTILCTQTKKQHGWFAPMDTISKEVASHRGNYFRFTQKNKAGNWGRMECMDAYGNYVKGNMAPYVLKLGSAVESDKSANEEWVEKLKTTCIYEFIADHTGKTIVQERAYDENMDIIYTYSRVPIGNNQFIGSYKDFSGLPAEMRESEDYTYGTLIKITEDQWGNDSIMQYVDANGVAKLNSDSVAMEVYIHDKYGRLIKQQSRNADGSLAIDNWGNCGVEYVWEGSYIKSASYMDDNWQPMRMPANRNADGKENIYRTYYKYDQYGRQIEEYYTDQYDNPDVNLLGTHRIVYKFDDKGNLIKQTGFDKKGNIIPFSKSGSSILYVDYYNDGRTKDIYWKDANNRPISTEGYLSRVHYEYDSGGKEILIERYSAESGEEKLCSMDKTTPEYKYTLWNDGTSRIDSLDAKGRTTFVGFHDAEGNLEKNNGRAYEVYSYKDQGKVTISTEIDYDENHNYIDVEGICKTVTKSDSITWTQTKWHYDSNDVLKETFVHRYTPGFDRLIGQDDANAFGELSRSGGSSGVRYYKGEVMRNHNGDFVSIYGRDEFGEADYITGNSLLYTYSKMFSNSGTKYYDENNQIVDDDDDLRDALPKVITIEVVDSAAYRLGLRDNDVIILYGDYAAKLDTIVSYYNFRQEWTLRSVLDAHKNKRMVVFRIEEASQNKYGLVEIDGLEGTTSELGFIAHIRYLTKKQTARIKQSIEENLESASPLLTREELRTMMPKGSNYVLLAFTEMYRSYRDYPYAKQVTDPAVLLGACIKDRKMRWTVEDGEDTDVFSKMLSSRKSSASRYPTMNFFLTKDAQTITPLVLEDQAVYTNWFDAYLTDEDYAQLSSLYTAANIEVEKLMNQPSAIPAKKLVGYWEIQPKEDDPYPVEGYLYLIKEGYAQGTVSNYGYIKFDEGYAIYKKTTRYDGSWRNGGNWLFLSPTENVSLECVDLLGADEDLKNRAVAYVNSNLKSDDDYLQSQLGKVKFFKKFNNELYIISYDKKSFMVNDSVIFVKEKKPKELKEKKPKTDAKVEPEAMQEIDDDNPLIGFWASTIPDVPNSYAELSLFQNGEMNLDMSITLQQQEDSITTIIDLEIRLEGTWQSQNPETFKMDFDPAKMSIDAAFDFDGVDEDTQKMIRAYLKGQVTNAKQELAMQMSKSFDMFGEDIEVSEVDTCKLVFNGNTWNRVPNERSIVLGRIEGDEGYLVDNGFSGLYVVLEWCRWNCRQDFDEFPTEFEKTKGQERHLVLLPVESVDGKDVFKDIIEVTCPPGLAGMRMSGSTISHPYYKYNILKRYIDWKINR